MTLKHFFRCLYAVEDIFFVAVERTGFRTDKREALRYIHFLKVNEHEMEVLTGLSDPHEAARRLHEWGVKEVLVTLGSMGSLIFNGTDFFRIPAYKPAQVLLDYFQ